MSVKDRLLEYLSYKNIGQTAFERKAGISNAYISKVKGSIGSTIIAKILSAADDLNRDWLLFGEGEMLKPQQNVGDVKNSTIVGANVSGNGNNITHYSKEEEDCKREVAYLKAIIVEKDTLITEKERLIQVLLDKK